MLIWTKTIYIKIYYYKQMQVSKEEEKIGNYVLGKFLGKGTFARVRQALHTFTQEIVAVKILDKQKIQDEEDKERILRQLEILRKIRHPNIIQLYQILETEDYIYIITEFAQKGELFKLIKRQDQLKQKAAGRLFLQLINAVQYLHRIGISHRDLKPQNILLDFDYNIKLIDFGLSNYFKNDLLHTACGSPCYAPPQMVSGKKYDGFRSDVWSMGIIFFVMVSGYLPFEDSTTKELYKKIIQGVYQMPNDISGQAKQVISQMLITNPQNRISLTNLRNLSFFNSIRNDQPQIIGIIIGLHPMPIDLQLLDQLRKHYPELEKSKAEQYIRSNRHNEITTTYYLIQKRILREGGKTNVDLQIYLESSPQFKKDYGKLTIEPIIPKKQSSVDSVIKYQKINRSLIKNPKKNQNRKKFKFNTNEWKITVKKDRSLSSKLIKNEYKSQVKNNQSLEKPERKTTEITANSPPRKSNRQNEPKKKQNKLGMKLWDAYFKNNLQIKTKVKQTSRINTKQKQRQNIFKQNLKQLKQGFIRLPQLATTRLQKSQEKMAN